MLAGTKSEKLTSHCVSFTKKSLFYATWLLSSVIIHIMLSICDNFQKRVILPNKFYTYVLGLNAFLQLFFSVVT